MYELKTSFIAETLNKYTSDCCAYCVLHKPGKDCSSCEIQPLIKITDRINDGEPVIDDTKLNGAKDGANS